MLKSELPKSKYLRFIITNKSSDDNIQKMYNNITTKRIKKSRNVN